jgi:epoxyqueuosine reductase
VINNRLDAFASKVFSRLQRAGHSAFPAPSSERVDDERICASFSHKLAARLCGFGWIGKSCLLITPDHGPRVRWVTVLTDAPLEPTGRPIEERCGDCKKCVDICPVKAFTGRSFKIGEAREARYDAKKCDRYCHAMESNGQLKVCGLCLYVCPFGMAS